MPRSVKHEILSIHKNYALDPNEIRNQHQSCQTTTLLESSPPDFKDTLRCFLFQQTMTSPSSHVPKYTPSPHMWSPPWEGPFIGFSRALQQEEEERSVRCFSICNQPWTCPSRSGVVRCWHGFFCVLVVKQVCPSLLICFLRFACYCCVSSKFLLFLPGERFCFHLSQGYILWSLRSTADSGWPLNVNYLSSSSMLCCNQLSSTLLDKRKKLPFVNQPVLLSWGS